MAAVLGAIGASRFLALAASPGEIDEAVFAGAVTHFDLFDLSPQAPGFPVWILIGRALVPLAGSAFGALCLASTLLASVGFLALYAWGRRLVGGWAALAGTVFAAALPVVWVNGGRAFSDTPATAFFLLALAALTASADSTLSRATRRGELAAGRRVRLLAIGAGLCAAAGAGVRPHLVLVFGPLLAVSLARLLSRSDRHDAAVSFVIAGIAGTAAWLAWLGAQAGGLSGLLATLHERAAFRSHAFATGTFGTLLDSFLVRVFLGWKRALFVAALSSVGLAALARRRRALLDLGLVLVPAFVSLWFLHSRAMSRYSVPFAMVLALAVGAGLAALARRGPLALALGFVLAVFFGREAYPEARWGATHETPPMAAIHSLERYVHPGRETIVADEVFHAFLRLERWEGRLAAWGYLEDELLSAHRQANRRWVRLADFTNEVDPPGEHDPLWRTWFHGGRVAEALGNRRLLAVAVRDPAPPLFGMGFGVKEHVEGKPSFRWAGRAAHVIVPGLQGPPVALLTGERPTEMGPDTLRVTARGHVLVERHVEPGSFDLEIVPPPVYGPEPGPLEYVVTCERPKPLPRLESAVRPAEGCFVFRDATASILPDELWVKDGRHFFVDIGSLRDRLIEPEGFHDRERIDSLHLEMRWTTGVASVLWEPVALFSPRRLVLRARPPAKEAVDVRISIGGVSAGTLRVPPGDFADAALNLPPKAAARLAGTEPVRIELSMPTWSPKRAGTGDDAREIGIGLDGIRLE